MYEQIGDWLTQFTTGYIARVSGDLATALIPIALVWVTVYVALYGYAVLRGEADDPLTLFVWNMMRVSLIVTVAISGLHYQQLIASTADGMQNAMAAIFLRGGQFDQSAPITVFQSLNTVSNRADDLVKQLWQQVGLSRLDLLAAALIFMAGTTMFLIVGTFVTLISKIVLTFALAIGPLAILCLLFKQSARFFDSWVSVVLSAIVLAWIVFFALGLSLYVVTECFRDIEFSGAFVPGSNPTGVSAIGAADGFFAVSVLLAVLLYQAPSLAASFTGGATIQMGMQMVSNVFTGTRSAALMSERLAALRSGPAGGGSIQRSYGPRNRD